ncbi:recombinase family protein [Waterburya agarophytonicola K14]|uniref:Recombinase family protein n=1 Tax=Waterburya agarophytonicola KI4 TaxID=2874699 RepID=A0A964BP60_9CYAN|nr:recombinase family protein [Waterburya agarophytonicola KI4]
MSSPLWISGTSRTGKTSRLVAEFSHWVRKQLVQPKAKASPQNLANAVLVFAANNQNRRELRDRLTSAVEGTYPVVCKTPVGFVSDEVMLFFPLIFEKLKLKAQFPLRLRPETEQELATQLWRNQSDWQTLCEFDNEPRLVRQTLDLMQLAGASGIPTEDISIILQQGLAGLDLGEKNQSYLWQRMGELLLLWQKWCLDRGFLTYGLIYELYWRYLLPNTQYQYHLTRRYQAIFADDVDDYPAIARDLFELILDRDGFAVFTYNPDGKIRLGLNADSDYLLGLAVRCHQEQSNFTTDNLATEFAQTAVELVTENAYLVEAPDSIQSLQTVSRAELLRQTAEIIIDLVCNQGVNPAEIAIIAPGLDEIARYSLIQILAAKNIPVTPVNEQRPIISSPLVRSLLTLLGLVYADLGRLVDRDAIAQMLVIFSQKYRGGQLIADIDPVRAGLIADYCYHVDPEHPYLSPVETFPRWDRLGHQAVAAYQTIVSWIEASKIKQQQQSFFTPTILLSEAIKYFLSRETNSSDRLAVLRELMETAQHFWEVDRRIRQNEPSFQSQAATVAQFIQLLRRGTITANPRPLPQLIPQQSAVTLATVFQYRSLRTSHSLQFWLDASSPLWSQGGAATLFAAPLFLKQWTGKTWMPEDESEMDNQRLQRILKDTMARAETKIFLCHSDLGVNGTEQAGVLLPLVHATRQYVNSNS